MADPVTLGAAIAARVKDAAVVGGRVFQAGKLAKFGERVTFPYVTWVDPIAETPFLRGDCSTIANARLVQVDLWQRMADEDAGLYRDLRAVLDGADVNTDEPGKPPSDQHSWAVTVIDGQRIDDPEPGIVHHAITVRATCAP